MRSGDDVTATGVASALRLVAGAPDTGPDAPRDDLRTTTRCRPSELPTTVALRLGAGAIAKAGADAHTAGLELSAWVRLTIEASRQCALTAALLNVARDALEQHLHAAARVTVPVTPVAAAAPTRAYLRSLADPDRLSLIRPPKGATLVVFAPYELATAWNIAAADSGEPLDAWAARQLDEAPGGVVAWELAAVLRGCYLGEWIFVTAAALARDGAASQPPPP